MGNAEDLEDIERAPIKDLFEMQKRKLQPALERASKSPLYRDRWRAAGIRPNQARDLENLPLLPFITSNELFEATQTFGNKVVTCSALKTWFASSKPAKQHEWFPLSERDYLEIPEMLARMTRAVGLRVGDVVLALTESLPRISPTIPFLWTCSEASKVCRLEFITASLEWYDLEGMTWIDFIRRRRPTVLFASTTNALALAERIQTDCKLPAREVLTETRVGIFHGEPFDDSKAKLMEAYSLEPYEVYSPTEHMSFWTECTAHRGIHVWLDTCIPEIVPVGRENAVPIWETSPGAVGELVITNFAESLPLIRYKTGESIRIEGTDRCPCGRTHPRIKRLPKTTT